MRANVILPVALAVITATSVSATDTGYNPNHEYVSNAAAAIAIGRAVLIPIYGEKQIQSEEPLIAKRQGNVWTVSGTLYCGMSWWEKVLGDTCLGGTAEVKLSVKTGEILQVTHYK
jgi:NTF2 fold immunity protein